MTPGKGQDSAFDHVGPRHMVSNRGWHTVWRLLGGLLCLGVGFGYLIGPTWATGGLTGGPSQAVGAFLVAIAAFLGLPVVADLLSRATLTLDEKGATERVPLRATRSYPWKACRSFWVWQPSSVRHPERYERVAVDFTIAVKERRPWWRGGGRLTRERRLLRASYGGMSASELAHLLNRYQFAYCGPGLTYHDLEEQAE